ncbi:MAG: sulfotransferase [Magnetococcales bacterium]|nr:sulfotransferase [Magnetococcales bacterium]
MGPLLAARPHPPTAPDPIFLVAFPRSGTTLLDQILGSHPRLQVMEEKPPLGTVQQTIEGMDDDDGKALAALTPTDLQRLRKIYHQEVDRHLTRNQESLLVDKFPLNINHFTLIKRLFPNSRIILALRHPCDVVLSNLIQNYRTNKATPFFSIWKMRLISIRR